MIADPKGPPFDPAFFTAQLLYHNQQGQDATNTAAHDLFVQQSKNWVDQNTQNRVLGLAISPLPTMPQKITYNDTGVIPPIVYSAFPDLVMPTLPPETVPGPTMTQVYAAAQAANLSDSQKLDSLLLSTQQIKSFLQIK